MRAFHQILPSLALGDGISNFAVELKALLLELGFESEIYARWIDPQLSHVCQPASELRDENGATVLYHYSIGDKPLSEAFERWKGRRIFFYHNLTPPSFFSGLNDGLVQMLRDGIEWLPRVTKSAHAGAAHTKFSLSDLRQAGMRNLSLLPPLLPLRLYARTVSDLTIEKLIKDGRPTLIFVGRLSPQKCQDELIRVLAKLKDNHGINAKLLLPGRSASERYREKLQEVAAESGLEDSVVFIGPLSNEALVACYRAADVFVCASAHEGFCVPVIEALHFELPVVARSHAALPETLGDGGVLVHSDDPSAMAEEVARILSNTVWRKSVIARGRARLSELSPERVREHFGTAIKGWVQ